MYKNKYLLLS